MSNRPMTGVREVLGFLAGSVQSVVDDLSGETARLRQQIAANKQAMQADVTRAEGVKPFMPRFVPLVEAYQGAKAEFAKLENAPDLRPALAAQGPLATAAQNLAAVRDDHDGQYQAMNACAQWKETHGAALKQALATKDVGTKAQPVQQAFATLDTASKQVDASLDKPDFVEALTRYTPLEQRLREFEKALAEASKPATPREAVKQAVSGGKLSEKVKDAQFRKEFTDWIGKADPSDPGQRQEMVAALKGLDPAEAALRKQVFQRTFKTAITSGARIYDFNAKPRKENGKDVYPEKFDKTAPVDPVALEAMADIMAQLPTTHMPKAWTLVGQNADKNTRGSYNDEGDMAELNYSLLDTKDGFNQNYSEGGGTLPGDPLENAKAFDLLIRHECGHKAGKDLAAKLTKEAYAGEWKILGSIENVLADIAPVVNSFVTEVQQGGQPAANAIRDAVAECLGDVGEIAKKLKIPTDRVPADHELMKVLRQGLSYMCGSSPVSVKGRMYIVGGPEFQWFSFTKAAWDQRLSLYQYATPDEWFAEFYAGANNGQKSIREAAKSRYPDAWNWLDRNGCIVVGK